ncbi:hypothetical protein VMF7928_01342 [Vibrio marisflavi CECT 7928]|uniref:EamA domain-containing protein n=1 Tax=Vibrio marisflavi CECT 7928 TaxID=634439 RepID=A0ABN8E280_9VIBR|nr:EamA family transporter [Vibrio marisflavi]CAH0537789.1 hypothetical protein VMF7928_01342 [Vibrio marisflavi CECT 7928]
MCAGVVYLLYMMLIHTSGPLFASLTNYLVPTFGVLIGLAFTREDVGANTWVALVLILFAVAINQTKRREEKTVEVGI